MCLTRSWRIFCAPQGSVNSSSARLRHGRARTRQYARWIDTDQPATMWPCVSLPKCEILRRVLSCPTGRRPKRRDHPTEVRGSRFACAILLRVRGDFHAGPRIAPTGRAMQSVVKGMVQVHSVTYRIVRVRAGHYDVVRLLDDVRVGAFSIGSRHETIIEGEAPEVVREVARAALQGGRTTWAPRRLSA